MLPFAEISPGGAGQVIPARAQTSTSATLPDITQLKRVLCVARNRALLDEP